MPLKSFALGSSTTEAPDGKTRAPSRDTQSLFPPSPLSICSITGLGGKSDWVSRLGARVLPSGASVVDDPSAKDFSGVSLIGGYAVDNEGVRAQKVTLVENGNLKAELMSRRPGPDAEDRKSTRLNSSHVEISYAVFC